MRLKKLFDFFSRPYSRSINSALFFCLFLLAVLAANGRELLTPPPEDSTAVGEKKQTTGQMRDTSLGKSQFDTSELSKQKANVIIPLSLRTLPPNLPSSLEQALTLSTPIPSASMRANADIISAWKSDLARQEEYRTLETILSSVEMTGTAYLTYLYLKRYGLK